MLGTVKVRGTLNTKAPSHALVAFIRRSAVDSALSAHRQAGGAGAIGAMQTFGRRSTEEAVMRLVTHYPGVRFCRVLLVNIAESTLSTPAIGTSQGVHTSADALGTKSTLCGSATELNVFLSLASRCAIASCTTPRRRRSTSSCSRARSRTSPTSTRCTPPPTSFLCAAAPPEICVTRESVPREYGFLSPPVRAAPGYHDTDLPPSASDDCDTQDQADAAQQAALVV